MPDSDRISIDNLTLAPDLSNNDVAPVVHTVNGVKSTYKATMTLLGTFLNKVLQYSADLTTSDKTIIGAINEINAGGGGGGAVILYGTSAPASSLGSDGNLYVQYTAGTGGASDVVDALYVKLDDEWCEISTGGGSGSGGHVIVDEDGTSLTQRANLQFNGAYLEDNSVDDTTEVNVVREMTKAQFNQLTADEKTGLINISDESLNATEIPITDGSQTNTKSYIDSGLSGKVDTTDFDATNLPITSGSATNTKDYIDNKATSLVDETGGGGPITAVNGTYQIPASVLTHKIIVICFRRYGYFGQTIVSKTQMLLGAYGAATRLWGDSQNYWDIKISDSGVITLVAINGTAFPFVDCFGIG